MRSPNKLPHLQHQESNLKGSLRGFKYWQLVNVGREILTHESGSDHFTYDTQGISEQELKSFGAYYIYGLQALDQPNEWWYNKDSNTLYYLQIT